MREREIPANPKRARAGLRLSGSISSIKRPEREGEEKRELPEEAESGVQEGPVLFTPEVRCSERFACSPLRLMQWRPGTPLIATGAESLGRGPLQEAREAEEVGKRRRVRGSQKMSRDTNSCVSENGRIAPG